MPTRPSTPATWTAAIPSRNLLVPPERGYGFHFERADALYARILDAVTDRVELVPRLDVGREKKSAEKPPGES